DADLVLLGHDLTLDLRDGRLRVTQRAERARRLQLRRDAEVEAIEEDVVAPLERLHTVAGDQQLNVEREELEVGLGQIADQCEPDAPPGFLGGQKRGPGRLVRATDSTPDVDLPRGGHRGEV